jgi:transcriptional regulator with XRE-family HTH domain
MTTALKGRPPVKAKNPEWERVGKTLQTLRERYGYSQEQFSQEAGISRSYMYLIEAGHKRVTNRLLSRFSDILGISPLAIKRADEEPEQVAA